jgi:hypothetical protein
MEEKEEKREERGQTKQRPSVLPLLFSFSSLSLAVKREPSRLNGNA